MSLSAKREALARIHGRYQRAGRPHQTRILDEGGTIHQETRLFDSATGRTESMRSKEDAHDYRYFPDPDLPPLVVTAAWIEAERAAMPELPAARQARFQSAFGLSEYDANLLVRLIPGGADYFGAWFANAAPTTRNMQVN